MVAKGSLKICSLLHRRHLHEVTISIISCLLIYQSVGIDQVEVLSHVGTPDKISIRIDSHTHWFQKCIHIHSQIIHNMKGKWFKVSKWVSAFINKSLKVRKHHTKLILVKMMWKQSKSCNQNNQENAISCFTNFPAKFHSFCHSKKLWNFVEKLWSKYYNTMTLLIV